MRPNVMILANKIKKRPTKEVARILLRVYLEGLAEGSNAEVVNDLKDTDRFVRVKKNTTYECVCPNCGTEMELDLLDLLDWSDEE